MYFYLSFLRPPPSTASLSAPIKITPQIANDLRTELFLERTDIFYQWLPQQPPSPPRPSAPSSPLAAADSSMSATRPRKLTAWRAEDAYKEIAVPYPPGVRAGQTWRLLLSASEEEEGGGGAVVLGRQEGRVPFPVMSMPIQFSAGKGGKEKQEQIERTFVLDVPALFADGLGRVSMVLREQTSFDLDKKIWDSGIGLSSWIAELRSLPEDEFPPSSKALLLDMKDQLFSREERNFIELGTGIGTVGLTLSALRSALAPAPGCVVMTDLASAIPLLEHNITANADCFAHCLPEAAVLDWDDPHVPAQLADRPLHAIIMADVTYNTSSFPALLATLALLLRRAPHPPLVLLGYKERDARERALWGAARAGAGLALERVGVRAGAGGRAVEVWVGRVAGVGEAR